MNPNLEIEDYRCLEAPMRLSLMPCTLFPPTLSPFLKTSTFACSITFCKLFCFFLCLHTLMLVVPPNPLSPWRLSLDQPLESVTPTGANKPDVGPGPRRADTP